MRYLKETHGAGGFDFTDDLMFANRSQVDEFCNAMIDSGLNTKWSGYLSVGVVNDAEGYELLYKSGCRSMIYGVESGSPKILKSVGKNMKLDKIKSNIELCANSGIVPIVMFMLGFPDETEEDLKETVKFALSLNLDAFLVNYYGVILKTPLADKLIADGKYTDSQLVDKDLTFSSKIEAMCAETLNNRIQKALSAAVTASGCDPCGLKYRISSSDYRLWRSISGNFGDFLKEAEFSISTDIDIDRFGIIH